MQTSFILLNLFSNLDWYTVVTGLIALISGVLSFILGLVELKDKEKKFLGVSTKSLKGFTTYLSFFMVILTLILQTHHELESRIAGIEKEQKADSTQRANLDTTLLAINRTLIAQQSTLNSTDKILKQQQQELSNQTEMLNQERKAVENYTQILKKQGLLSDDIRSSINLLDSNLESQQQSMAILNNTARDLETLNFPLSNSVGVVFKVRVYIDGFSEVWKDDTPGAYQLLRLQEPIDSLLNKKFKKPNYRLKSSYYRFFWNTSSYGLDHEMAIINHKESADRKILFTDFKGWNNNGMWVAEADIFYNPSEKYFEFPCEYGCGFVTENLSGVSNFAQVLDSSELYLKIRYYDPPIAVLYINNEVEKKVNINRVTISQLIGVKYGNSIQYILSPVSTVIPDNNKSEVIKKLWNQDINKEELWRYSIIKIPIRRG